MVLFFAEIFIIQVPNSIQPFQQPRTVLKQHPTSSNSTLQNSLQQPPAVIYSLQQSSTVSNSLRYISKAFISLQTSSHSLLNCKIDSLEQPTTAYNRLQPFVVVQPSYLQ